MRPPRPRHGLVAGLVVALGGLGATGCTARARPYRFASPMLGTAEVPAPALGDAPAPPSAEGRRDRPALAQREAEHIRVVSAPTIREASAAAALAITAVPAAQPEVRASLPAPHLVPAGTAEPTIHEPADLRHWVGLRDRRSSLQLALAWSRSLGHAIDLPASTPGDGGDAGDAASGAALIAWAERSGRLADPDAIALPGDLVVFDRATSDDPADLVGVAIGRDARGVTELIYAGGGVVRRGYVDAARPAMRRDAHSAVVNTYLRHGKRWPSKGSHYLAGELLAHVIHLR